MPGRAWGGGPSSLCLYPLLPPSRPGLGLPPHPPYKALFRPVPLTSSKLGGPKSWKLRKSQVLRAPPPLGGLKGQIPS